MRTLWFVFAAVFSLVALAGSWFALPGWVSVVAIILADVFLLLGFYDTFQNRVEEPIAFDEVQEETIRQMKAEGNTSLAIRQVQMWFRYASAEDAARAVREL
ncbi:hypothetical protein M3B04_07650 [Corynebacterium sanguinis]|uniref:hypothetical protein n=1 Tax=Corynebacterium sanguinis TaxID=2594913 RepID=UPI00223B8E87|nr:hypothetical protein [Corynebacterium sanguinis]MCT1628813.1 hypothetical protein [Corynebacterium sanguinis]